jgi:NTP pyrophosphatase (non-canonical NTP hydrolase)
MRDEDLTIGKLVKESGEISASKGWHSNPATSFGDRVALCHSELSEALEEFRSGRGVMETYYSALDLSEVKKPEGVPAELADVIIRIADMCYIYGIDLEAAILEKLAYNKTRPHRHGGKVL